MIERKHPLAQCELCPLVTERCAKATGPENAKIAFVSRSPGKHDVIAGRPFAGPSGKVLDYLLGRYGINRNEILTTNVVLCRTEDPPKEAIAACKERLEDEIKNAELVIAGGTEATASLTKYRAVFTGRPFVHRRVTRAGTTQRVIVTNNPAAVIHNSDAFPDMVEDFRRAFDPPPDPVFPEVEIITDAYIIQNVLRQWQTTDFGTPLASDLEWAGTRIECAGFSAKPDKAVVLAGEGLRAGNNLLHLGHFYEREDVQFIWHNGKSDTTVLHRNNIKGRVDEDTYLMSVALDERPGYHSLEYLLSTRFGWPDYEPQSVKDFKKTGELEKPDELYKYNGWDTAGTLQLYNDMAPRVQKEELGEVYRRTLRAADAFRTVEMHGVYFDTEEACNINEREALPRLFELTEHIREITGHSLLNPRSPKQLQSVIYQEWGLKHKLKDSGKKKLQTSTGREVRDEIEAGRFTCNAGHREQLVRWASAQRQFSKIDKLRGTYLEGLTIRAQADGRIYCNFNVGGTVTGRPSSNDPNLQNIAREGYEDIPGIRTLFLPSPGNVIISADFSQAELRTCAKLSGDERLLGIYRDSSRSLHKERAAAFYGENYTKSQYVQSKNINFGVTYGQSADAFAQMYHMPKHEAQEYIDSWWAEFPTLKDWTNELKQRARKEGRIVSPFGHRRRFHLITDENIGDIEREAVNFLPQNIAAWVTISAMVELVNCGIPVIASVHDSIVADIPADEIHDVAHTMKEVMESQAIKELGWTDIPFTVDVSVGPNWGALDEIELEAIAA